MTYEDDRFFIPEKYRKMSVEELEEEKEKILKEIKEQNKEKTNESKDKSRNQQLFKFFHNCL